MELAHSCGTEGQVTAGWKGTKDTRQRIRAGEGQAPSLAGTKGNQPLSSGRAAANWRFPREIDEGP